MHVVLLRVGVDTGSGGIHGPLFSDGSFEYISIPDRFRGKGVDGRTYGTCRGRHGRALCEYFPESRRKQIASQPIHVDPEFATFTYGDLETVCETSSHHWGTPSERTSAVIVAPDVLAKYVGSYSGLGRTPANN